MIICSIYNSIERAACYMQDCNFLFLENALREKYSTKIDQEVDSVIQKYKQQIENGK